MIINMGIIIVNTPETQSSLLTTVALLQAVLELLSHMIFINSCFFQLVFEFILTHSVSKQCSNSTALHFTEVILHNRHGKQNTVSQKL